MTLPSSTPDDISAASHLAHDGAGGHGRVPPILDDEAAGTLVCEVSPNRDVVVVTPHGELDFATAPALDDTLRELRDSGFEKLVVDLRGLAFMDSAGVHLLLRWTEWAGGREDGFRVVPGSPRITRVLEMTGIAPRLRFTRRGPGA